MFGLTASVPQEAAEDRSPVTGVEEEPVWQLTWAWDGRETENRGCHLEIVEMDHQCRDSHSWELRDPCVRKGWS